MITAGLFFLLLGLIVFGPKKTVELAQSMGHILAQVKHATGQVQASKEMPIPDKPAGIGLKENFRWTAWFRGPERGEGDTHPTSQCITRLVRRVVENDIEK